MCGLDVRSPRFNRVLPVARAERLAAVAEAMTTLEQSTRQRGEQARSEIIDVLMTPRFH
jgi:hypothetical protein